MGQCGGNLTAIPQDELRPWRVNLAIPFVVIEHGSRRVVRVAVTMHPSAARSSTLSITGRFAGATLQAFSFPSSVFSIFSCFQFAAFNW